jgi:hypothetical protein
MDTGLNDFNTGDNMSDVMNLGDIPDLSGIGSDFGDAGGTKFENGWYQGVILGTRTFTDKNGNERVFESQDVASAKGDSRNLRLQVELKRKDGRTLNVSTMVNYSQTDLTQETVQAIAAKLAEAKASGEKVQWGTLFRSYMALSRLSALQKIAGVRQFQRSGDGALDITPLFGKAGFFRLKDDDRNPQYKDIDKFQDSEPRKVPVL